MLLLVSTVNFVGIDVQASSVMDEDDTSDIHDCFACCGHVIPVEAAKLSVRFEPMGTFEFTEEYIPNFEATSVFHPPQL
jgi:hypothetical protein